MKKGELVELLARFGDDETVLIRLDRPTLTVDPGGNPILQSIQGPAGNVHPVTFLANKQA